jgi:UDP-N-acetyl-2-amino-2-deoxyglucuronate dehydrogenase
MAKNIAITGVAGYIAPRHLRAIRETGNRLIAAVDPKDSVGMLDQFGFDVRFFTEFERFDRYLEKLRRGPVDQRVHYLSICAPNYLHDAHCRLGLRVGADVICEKPLVISPWNLDALQELEQEAGMRIYSIMQLRLHPKLLALREQLQQTRPDHKYEVCLTYVTARGGWYHVSWKGSGEKSGGLACNIGIHFFDLLIWLFGAVAGYRVYHVNPQRMAGFLELERARVKWFLSVDPVDLPFPVEPGKRTTYRSITLDDTEIEFTEGFTDLHTRAYEEIFAGRGFGIEEARPSIDLAYRLRTAPIHPGDAQSHPFLTRLQR